MEKRIGIMGGTFDPIHMGHLITAEMVRCAAFLDRILFVPSARPPHKDGTRTASPEDRLIMTEYAVRENLHFSVSDIELHRNGPSYTVDTIAELQSRLDGADLFFITGADAMNDLYLWHEPSHSGIANTASGDLIEFDSCADSVGTFHKISCTKFSGGVY